MIKAATSTPTLQGGGVKLKNVSQKKPASISNGPSEKSVAEPKDESLVSPLG